MVKKRFGKKGQEDSVLSYKMLLRILLILAVAIVLYFMLRSIGNAFVP